MINTMVNLIVVCLEKPIIREGRVGGANAVRCYCYDRIKRTECRCDAGAANYRQL